MASHTGPGAGFSGVTTPVAGATLAVGSSAPIPAAAPPPAPSAKTLIAQMHLPLGVSGVALAKYARAQISWLRGQKCRRDEKIAVATNFVMRTEVSLGGKLINADSTPYLFDGCGKQLYLIDPREDGFMAHLVVRYGLLPNDDIGRSVATALRAFAISQGEKCPVRRFAYFDKESQTLYLSRYDGTSWRLDGTNIETVPNGTGAVFLDDDGGKSCPGVVPAPGNYLFPALIDGVNYAPQTSGGMSRDDQRCLLACWIHAIAFPDLMPSKPLLLVVGSRGAGKTTAVQNVQLAITGDTFTLTVGQRGEEDFGVTILRQPIALLDNIDTPIEWLKDALCAYTTDGGWRRRKKYTDTGQINIKPQAFVALATKNPDTFRRDDVADRCLIVRLERRASFTPLDVVRDAIRRDRAMILGEYLYTLNQVVNVLRQGVMPLSTAYRMADFARFAHIVGPILGFVPDEVDGMLQAVQMEREEITIEGDSLVDMLDRWLEVQTNVGRAVKVSDLHSELAGIAARHSLTFYKSPRTLHKRLREIDTALTRHFRVTQRNENGQVIYEFRRM